MAKSNSKLTAVLAEFSKNLKSAAREAGISESAVTPLLFWKHARGITEWEVRKLGGFANLKRQLHPVKFAEDETSAFWTGQEIKQDAKNIRLAMRDESFFKSLEKFADRVFAGRAKPSKNRVKSSKKTGRVVTAVLSDLHFGSNIRKDETGHEYQIAEESRRLARVVNEVAEYKSQYREESELELLILGDIIQNRLHSPIDGAAIAEQCARAIHLLSQAITYLAGKYKKVRVRMATGNHGRNMATHPNRAVDQKWDSLETIIYYALKSVCRDLPNTEFFIPKTPYGIYEVFGRRILYTHGDSVLKPGNPGRAIDINSLEGQANRINASLVDTQEVAVFIVGHVHVGSVTHLNNGSVMVTNGALCPPDQFATSIGIFESNGGQYVFESVKDFPFGDSRYIRVGTRDDKDESLNDIIKPWESL